MSNFSSLIACKLSFIVPLHLASAFSKFAMAAMLSFGKGMDAALEIVVT